MIPFILIGGGAYLIFEALGTNRPSFDPLDYGFPTKGYRGYRKGKSYLAKGGTVSTPPMKKLTLKDLEEYDSMYYIGHLIDHDGDGWVFEEDALKALDIINKGEYSKGGETGGTVSISDEDYEFWIGGEDYLGKAIKENGVIVGGIAYSDEDKEIQGISIKNKFRKKGIAKKAVKKLFDNDQDLEAVYVRSVPKSKKFWEKIGTDFERYNDDAGLWEGTLKRYEDGGDLYGGEKSLVGKRIRLIKMENDPRPVEPGTMGTIKHVGGGVYNVDWDNGRTLGVVKGEDQFEIMMENGGNVPTEEEIHFMRKFPSGMPRKLLSSDEIKMANKLVKKGYMEKGITDDDKKSVMYEIDYSIRKKYLD